MQDVAAVQDRAPRETPSPALNEEPAANKVKEESVNEYMDRLMQRIRNETGEPQSQPSRAPRSEPARAAREASATVSAAETPTPQPESSFRTAEPAPSENAQIMPRSTAREKHFDLSALRELANQSANSAIDRHARGKLIAKMYSKLMLAIASLVAGTWLLWIWHRSNGNTWFYWSVAAFMAAAFWGVQYAMVTGRLIVAKSGASPGIPPPPLRSVPIRTPINTGTNGSRRSFSEKQ